MLKIVGETRKGGGTVLRIEGQIIGPWVEELARACEPVLACGDALSLDLATVSFVSREGIGLLSSLRARRVALVNCSAFVSEQLRGEELHR